MGVDKFDGGELNDGNKYHREIIGLCGTKVTVDVYRVLDAFITNDPILDHLIKKALCAGSRGHKDKITDYQNILESAQKALELQKQKILIDNPTKTIYVCNDGNSVVEFDNELIERFITQSKNKGGKITPTKTLK